MNKLNERTIESSDLVVISTKLLNDTIEVFPGYFVRRSSVRAELTNAGRNYLRKLYEMFLEDLVDVDDILRSFSKISKDFSYGELVEDKLYYEFEKLFN